MSEESEELRVRAADLLRQLKGWTWGAAAFPEVRPQLPLGLSPCPARSGLNVLQRGNGTRRESLPGALRGQVNESPSMRRAPAPKPQIPERIPRRPAPTPLPSLAGPGPKPRDRICQASRPAPRALVLFPVRSAPPERCPSSLDERLLTPPLAVLGDVGIVPSLLCRERLCVQKCREADGEEEHDPYPPADTHLLRSEALGPRRCKSPWAGPRKVRRCNGSRVPPDGSPQPRGGPETEASPPPHRSTIFPIPGRLLPLAKYPLPPTPPFGFPASTASHGQDQVPPGSGAVLPPSYGHFTEEVLGSSSIGPSPHPEPKAVMQERGGPTGSPRFPGPGWDTAPPPASFPPSVFGTHPSVRISPLSSFPQSLLSARSPRPLPGPTVPPAPQPLRPDGPPAGPGCGW
ncbi:uncharacterized protein [Heliangelus exortis]|uniref:uncharacterized protein n=1 Tax=Heliangelus exortis TaxID=472823 RepID=UPI003A8E657D